MKRRAGMSRLAFITGASSGIGQAMALCFYQAGYGLALVAIEAGDSYRAIPWQMGIVAKILRVMPNAVFDCLLASRPRKGRL